MRVLHQAPVKPVGVRLDLRLDFEKKIIEGFLEAFVLRVTGHPDLAPAGIFADNRFKLAHVEEPFFKRLARLQRTMFQVFEVRFQAFPIRQHIIGRQKMPHRFFQFGGRCHHHYLFLAAFFGLSVFFADPFFSFSSFAGPAFPLLLATAFLPAFSSASETAGFLVAGAFSFFSADFSVAFCSAAGTFISGAADFAFPPDVPFPAGAFAAVSIPPADSVIAASCASPDPSCPSGSGSVSLISISFALSTANHFTIFFKSLLYTLVKSRSG